MPSFSTEVTHNLGQVYAQQRLQDYATQVAHHFRDSISGLEQTWKGNVLTFSLRVFAFTVSGNMAVHADRVRVEGHLPLLAMAYRGKVEQTLADEIRKELSRESPDAQPGQA